MAASMHRVLLWALIPALLAGGGGGRAAEEPDVELYFELKLLVRGQRAGRTVAVDDWAGGRLRMRESGRGDYRLLRPIEDPWTFRWYPTLGEAKLGGAVWVAEPSGDVFSQPAASLIPIAEQKHRDWWNGDRVQPTAPELPSFSSRTEAFWSEQHRTERRDPLHADPVYPFHVLGDPAGRLRFAVDPGGALLPDSVVQTMTTPWLADGWADSLAGRPVVGYGFWGAKRPQWEPRTYETIAAALRLLGAGRAPVQDEFDLLDEAAGVVCALLPRNGCRLNWSGTPEIRWTPVEQTAETLTVRGESASEPLHGRTGGRYSVFRFTRLDRTHGRVDQDELQLLVEQAGDEALKLWIRIGHVRERDESAEIRQASPARAP